MSIAGHMLRAALEETPLPHFGELVCMEQKEVGGGGGGIKGGTQAHQGGNVDILKEVTPLFNSTC